MRGRRGRALLVAVAVLAAGGIAWWLTRNRGIEVRVVPAGRGPVEAIVAEDGEVRLVEDHVIAAPIAGELGPVEKEEGQRLEAGEAIAEIDAFELERELEALRARLEAVKGRIAVTERTKPIEEERERVERNVAIARAGTGAASAELDAARRAEERARAEAARYRALLEKGVVTPEAEERVRKESEIRAADLLRAEAHAELAREQEKLAGIERAIFLARGEDPELARKVHEADLDALRARIEGLSHRIGKTQIRSAWSGVVLERYTKGSRVVAAGAPILRVGDPSAKEVYVDVLIADLHRVRAGMPARIGGPALGGKGLEGKVKKVFPSAFMKISSLGVEQYRVWVVVELDDPSTDLVKPGFEVDVEIVTDARAHVLRVPANAIFRHGEGDALFTVRRGHAAITRIVPGIRGEEWVEVREGLEEGAPVIADPPSDLEEGGRVRPRRREEIAAP